MNARTRTIVAVIIAGLWVGFSEFFRNQVLLPATWAAHYKSLGLEFPSAPVNGLIWVVWSFIFAGIVYAVSRRFSVLQTTVLVWIVAFPLMWLVLWNLLVLPMSTLIFAVPLSLLECFLAAYICLRLAPK